MGFNGIPRWLGWIEENAGQFLPGKADPLGKIRWFAEGPVTRSRCGLSFRRESVGKL
jgi:hypothetical protein